jgi:hypothetical protein
VDELSENRCLALLMVGLKRRGRAAPPSLLARCARHLSQLYSKRSGRPSYVEVARRVGASAATVRRWAKLADAHPQLLALVDSGSIWPSAAQEIAITIADRELQAEVARAVSGWGEPEIVRLVRLLRERPGLTVAEAKAEVEKEAIMQVLQRELDDG